MASKNYNNQTIVLGMSGGVDSSVCALLLKKLNYDVKGVFMQNWDEYVNSDFAGHVNEHQETCNVQKDYQDMVNTCKQLNIPYDKIDFIKDYWKDVFEYTLEQYKLGLTPNPDILCNKYIKFDKFVNYAKKKYGTEQIAMGHYANTKIIKGVKYLTLAKDQNKDQTYFLCWLNQKQLDNCIFPLGNLKKNKVKKIAKNNHLDAWQKKESTGVCFIGERKFEKFLQNYLPVKKGKFIDINTNKVIGTHNGACFYTIGQNRNLNLGGQSEKMYVVKKDIKNNIVYVSDHSHCQQYLVSQTCEIKDFNWINGKVWPKNKIKVRFRHRQKLIKANFYLINNQVDKIQLTYKPTSMVVPGQFAVFYYKKICLGGGIIDKIIK